MATRIGLEQLAPNVLALSESQNWDDAKHEWFLENVYYTNEGMCLCGQRHIKEICVLSNIRTRNVIKVGSRCVKRFIGLPATEIFASLHKIAADIRLSLSLPAIQWVHERGFVTDWEREFLLNTRAKNRFALTQKQYGKRLQINTRILNKCEGFVERGRADTGASSGLENRGPFGGC